MLIAQMLKSKLLIALTAAHNIYYVMLNFEKITNKILLALQFFKSIQRKVWCII